MIRKTPQKGFTLIELIIVIVIIGILAAIAVTVMQNIKIKAITSEAVNTLGTLRTAARQYYAQYGGYPTTVQWLVSMSDATFTTQYPCFHSVNDLQGTYFGKECYQVRFWGDTHETMFWCCYINPSASGGPQDNSAVKAKDTLQLCDSGYNTGMIVMDQNGFIMQQNASKTGFQFLTDTPKR